MNIFLFLFVLIFPNISFSSQLWTEYPGTPVVSNIIGYQSWEINEDQEPKVVVLSNNTLLMAYNNGAGAIGFATSSDGYNWTKNSSNPIIGNGSNSVAIHQSLFQDPGGTLYIFYTNNDNGADLYRAQSSDNGNTWTNITDVVTTASLPNSTTGVTNTFVYKAGNTYHLFAELAGGYYKIYHATSTDLTTWTWTPTTPLTNLYVSSGVTSSGPNVQQVNGTYYMWYHAASAPAENIPTDIYFASSPDLINWTQLNGVVISRASELYLSNIPHLDQTADPCIIQFKGVTFAYYTRGDNTTPRFDIALRTYNGSISDLISGIIYRSKNTAGLYNASLN